MPGLRAAPEPPSGSTIPGSTISVAVSVVVGGHHLASTGIDPALLYEAELRGLVRQACTPLS